MAKADPETYAANLKLYEKLVATNQNVQRKGATMPYTSVNGHMFSLFTKEAWLALRLPTEEGEAFLKKYKTKLCEQYGTVMPEYVPGPARSVEEDAGTAEVLRLELRVRQLAQAKANDEEKTHSEEAVADARAPVCPAIAEVRLFCLAQRGSELAAECRRGFRRVRTGKRTTLRSSARSSPPFAFEPAFPHHAPQFDPNLVTMLLHCAPWALKLQQD